MQPAAERKKLREDYKALQHSITADEAELLELDNGKLEKYVLQASELRDKVQHPYELAQDAITINRLTGTLTKAAILSVQTEQGITPHTILTALKAKFGTGDAAKPVDWKRLGLAVTHALPFTHGVSTLLGAEPEARRERKQAQRRTKQDLPAPVTATQLDNIEDDSNQQETDKNMEDMWQKLKEVKSTPALELVLNHQSFSQTVENTFSLQFLAKDRRVQLTHDEEKGIIVHAMTKDNKSKEKGGEARQMVWHWTMTLWEEVKKSVAPEDCLMPHRDY